MSSSNGLNYWGLGVALATLAFPTLANAEPVDQAGAKHMASGWLAVGRTRLSARFSDKVGSVQAYGDFHVVELEPEGFIVTAADDDLEPVIAFSAKGKFDAAPDNPLWILLNQDMPQRKANIRAVRDRQKAHIRAGHQQADSLDTRALRESDRSKAKWERFRNHQAAAPPASKTANSGPGYALPTGGIADSNSIPARAAIRIKSIKVEGGQVELTHDSPGSVSILASYDAGNSWQTLDSGVFQSTWVSSRVAREASCWFKVEEDGVFDEMTVEMMRNPPPYLPTATDMVGDTGTTNTGNAPLSDTYLVSVSDIRIPPIVQSQWSQSLAQGRNCYNLYTPNNYVSGCVATALAQMLRYWQYPATGIGQVTRTIYVNGSSRSATTRGGNGSGGPYNWSLMPLTPETATYSDAAWQMIGSLCYDAGVSVNMQYSSGSSGAYEYALAGALTGVFGYASAKYVYPPNLLNAINSNLEAGYPVMLGIDANGSYGHSILCDGFGYSSGTMYHHLNLGWAGSCDWWYTLPAIGGPYPWNSVHCIIFNIFPTGTGELISGRVTTAQGVPVQAATITATYSGQNFTGTSDSKGYYGIKVPASRVYSVTASKAGMNAASRSGVTVGTSTSPSYPAYCGNAADVDFSLSSFAFTAVALTNSVWLRWTAPTNSGLPNNTVYIRWSSDRYPTNISDGTEIYSGTAQVFEHTGRDGSGTVTNFYTIWGNNGSPYTSVGGNNQASAVPDPGKFRLHWKGRSDGALYTWILATNGVKKAAVQPATGDYSQYDVISTMDVNGDARAELLWKGKTSGLVYLWFMNPDGSRASSLQPATGDYSQYDLVSTFDVNGDGRPELFWKGKASGLVYLWFMNPDGSRASSVQPATGDYSQYDLVSTFDVNGDGRPELLWKGKNNGLVYLWFMNPDGSRSSSVQPATGDYSQYDLVSTFDVNGDGRPELLWKGKNNGLVYLWLMNPSGTRASSLQPATGDYSQYDLISTLDVSADGRPELLWKGKTNGLTYLWFMNANGTKAASVQPATGDYSQYDLISTFDVNGDGRLELLWKGKTSGLVYIWFMNQNGSRAASVQPGTGNYSQYDVVGTSY